MWLIVTKDMQGNERRVVAHAHSARTLAKALVDFGLPVETYPVTSYRDPESCRHFVIDKAGLRWWIRDIDNLLFLGFSEVDRDEVSG